MMKKIWCAVLALSFAVSQTDAAYALADKTTREMLAQRTLGSSPRLEEFTDQIKSGTVLMPSQVAALIIRGENDYRFMDDAIAAAFNILNDKTVDVSEYLAQVKAEVVRQWQETDEYDEYREPWWGFIHNILTRRHINANKVIELLSFLNPDDDNIARRARNLIGEQSATETLQAAFDLRFNRAQEEIGNAFAETGQPRPEKDMNELVTRFFNVAEICPIRIINELGGMKDNMNVAVVYLKHPKAGTVTISAAALLGGDVIDRNLYWFSSEVIADIKLYAEVHSIRELRVHPRQGLHSKLAVSGRGSGSVFYYITELLSSLSDDDFRTAYVFLRPVQVVPKEDAVSGRDLLAGRVSIANDPGQPTRLALVEKAAPADEGYLARGTGADMPDAGLGRTGNPETKAYHRSLLKRNTRQHSIEDSKYWNKILELTYGQLRDLVKSGAFIHYNDRYKNTAHEALRLARERGANELGKDVLVGDILNWGPGTPAKDQPMDNKDDREVTERYIATSKKILGLLTESKFFQVARALSDAFNQMKIAAYRTFRYPARRKSEERLYQTEADAILNAITESEKRQEFLDSRWYRTMIDEEIRVYLAGNFGFAASGSQEAALAKFVNESREAGFSPVLIDALIPMVRPMEKVTLQEMVAALRKNRIIYTDEETGKEYITTIDAAVEFDAYMAGAVAHILKTTDKLKPSPSDEKLEPIVKAAVKALTAPAAGPGPMAGGISDKELTTLAQSDKGTPQSLVAYLTSTGLFAQADVIRNAIRQDSVKLAEFERRLAAIRAHPAAAGRGAEMPAERKPGRSPEAILAMAGLVGQWEIAGRKDHTAVFDESGFFSVRGLHDGYEYVRKEFSDYITLRKLPSNPRRQTIRDIQELIENKFIDGNTEHARDQITGRQATHYSLTRDGYLASYLVAQCFESGPRDGQYEIVVNGPDLRTIRGERETLNYTAFRRILNRMQRLGYLTSFELTQHVLSGQGPLGSADEGYTIKLQFGRTLQDMVPKQRATATARAAGRRGDLSKIAKEFRDLGRAMRPDGFGRQALLRSRL